MTERVKVTQMVDQEDVDTLATIAARNDRSLAAEIRIAIREHIRTEKEDGNGNES